jgi:glycosyltransferase involved in cell wall biosynthesis
MRTCSSTIVEDATGNISSHVPGYLHPTRSVARRPRVCFVAPNFWPVFSGDPSIQFAGGAEVQQNLLTRMMARHGYEVSVICQDFGQPADLVHDGVRVVHSYRPEAGLPVLRFFHPRMTGIWKAMQLVNADIYYVRSAGMVLSVVAAFCRRHGKKSIYAGASDSDFTPGKQLIEYARDRWLFERGLAMADAIVVQNEEQKRLCANHYHRNSVLIPSVYTRPAPTGTSNPDSVLWVAVMRRTKRPELFLEMASHLPQRRFVMIGGPAGTSIADHQYFETIRSIASTLPNVEFLGFLPQAKVETWFDRAHVVVNTSVVEGVPNTFLQSWARGVPTIAFVDTGAKLNGASLYPVVNDAAEGAATIERMFVDPNYHGRASANCLEYFNKTHDSVAILGRYQRLMHELVETQSPSSSVAPALDSGFRRNDG